MNKVDDDLAYSIAMATSERVTEYIETKLMPEGKTFSEEQWERVSDEVFEAIRTGVRWIEVDPEDYDQ